VRVLYSRSGAGFASAGVLSWDRGGDFIGDSRRRHLKGERTGVVRVWPDDRFSMALKK
jgi:hypothetical protein